MEPGLDTRLVHLASDPAINYGFVSPPLYRGSTVLYQSVQEMEECGADPLFRKFPAYGRFGTPSTREFESALAELEGGWGTVCTSSGLSAVTTAIYSLVKSGDHILVSDSVYFPTRLFCDSLRKFGVQTEFYDPTLGGEIIKKFRTNTRLVFMESPGSVTFEVQDVPAIASACRSHGICSLIDNTWATPVFFQPIRHGVDISIHAATKFITGHSDSFLGAIICNEAAYPLVRAGAVSLGQCAGVDDVNLGLRGLRTLGTRLREHQSHAIELAKWLQTRPEVLEVIYPALPEHPGHEIWRRDFSGAAGIFSFVLQPQFSKVAVDKLLNGLELFGLGFSWGGFESLLVPIDPSAYRDSKRWQKRGVLLRAYIGLENVEDLRGDLERGLRQLVDENI